MTKTDHPIFGEFKAFEGEVPSQFVYDFVGSFMDSKFSFAQRASQAGFVKASIPSLSDEYFEWVSLLEAAKAARTSFTVVELGAGYGRWAARAALAARQRG